MSLNLRENLTFGFEQTFTIEQWWNEPGFISTSDTPKKREMMLALSEELAHELKGSFFESKDIWDHMQYEVCDSSQKTQFYVTMDPGSIEVKTPPCLAKDTEKMSAPLFEAAKRSGLVPYRNWWYGVKSGTEGGCHVNMGGFTQETNPLHAKPELVVKYAAYIHNRPWLHYPFMGIDVGPEGNAMRMDEKDGFNTVKKSFTDYREIYRSGESLSPQKTYDHFKDTNLISDKSSFPSLYKFKTGLFLIEDRAQEALRSAEDFLLVSELRLQILEKLEKENEVEELKNFPNLHLEELTSFFLWDKFKDWSKGFNLETEKFERFFQRQFPNLTAGENKPISFAIKDGRRPRVITEIKKRGDVVISKAIDTHFKRFEVYSSHRNSVFTITAKGIEKLSKPLRSISGETYHYIDIEYDEEQPLISIEFKSDIIDHEKADFNVHNMMWN